MKRVSLKRVGSGGREVKLRWRTDGQIDREAGRGGRANDCRKERKQRGSACSENQGQRGRYPALIIAVSHSLD